MTVCDDWLELSLLAEPGDAALTELLAECEPGAVVAAARGKAKLAVPDAWRQRAAQLELLLGNARARAEAAGLRWVPRGSSDWPALLDDLDFAEPAQGVGGAPLGLWLRGSGDLLATLESAVAVVGARACTGYGATVASELGADLADHGWTVVSGAAFGVDASAHRGALVMDRPTIAVLACGADLAYPQANASLLNRIAENGLVVSEQAPGAEPRKARFLTRNRLIAALTSGTVVVEAAARSGSLNTLHWADRLGRACMAVPGPVTAQMSVGVHAAIRAGEAVMVTGADDVEAELASVGWAAQQRDGHDLPPLAEELLAVLEHDRPQSIAELAARTAMPTRQVRPTLALLQQRDRAVSTHQGWCCR